MMHRDRAARSSPGSEQTRKSAPGSQNTQTRAEAGIPSISTIPANGQKANAMTTKILGRANDDSHMAAAKLLVMSGQIIAALGADPASKEAARLFHDGVLSAAAAGGYANGDALRAALASPGRSNRLLMMAREACKAASPGAMRTLIGGLSS